MKTGNMRISMNFALYLFCVPVAAQLLSQAFAAGDTRSVSLPKGTRGGSTSFIGARRDLAKAEEVDSPKQLDLPAEAEETDGFYAAKQIIQHC
jgi:hypothetical protein